MASANATGSSERGAPLDFGKLLRFFFEDPNWVTKIILGGLFALLSTFLIGSVFVAGYVVGVTRRAARGEERPLPEWDDLAKLFTDGLKALVVYLCHILPLILLVMLLGLALGGAASVETGEGPQLVRMLTVLVVVAGWGLFTVASLVLMLYVPAAFTRFVLHDRIGAAFDFLENLSFIKRNLGNYGLALLAFLASSIMAPFAIILFCVGVFPASFWSSCVLGYALGEVARRDAGSSPARQNLEQPGSGS